MRLKYSNQLSVIWSSYHEIKYLYESVMADKEEDLESLEMYAKMEGRKYNKTMEIFPTINLLHNLTIPWYFRTNLTTVMISKEEILASLTTIKNDLENKIINITNLFKIEGRIKKGEDPDRVLQIQSVRKSIQKLKKHIEVLTWYEDLVKHTDIIEEKTKKMMEEDYVKNNKENV